MMKRFVLVTLALAFVAVVHADDKTKIDPAKMMQKMKEVGTPGAEHKKLDKLAGKWTYVCKFYPPGTDKPIETKGTVERKWILGDRFVEEKYSGEGLDGKSKFEGCGIVGYDKSKKQYVFGWIDNTTTGVDTMYGKIDASGKTFTFEKDDCVCPLSNEKFKARSVLKFETDDKVVFESYANMNGKDVKIMEVVTVRTK